jgi:fatty acid desaturase
MGKVLNTAIQEEIYSNHAIPEKRNVAIFLLTVPVLWGLLWTASHMSIGFALLAAWFFAMFNHVPFSLLHESVHGVLLKNKKSNYLFGVICGAFFPTSQTLQKVAHLGHHRRNRTNSEMYDYYLPSESKTLRNFMLYSGNLCGMYWFCIPLSNLIYILAPWLYTSKWFVQGVARHGGFEPYVREIAAEPKLRIWLECVFSLVYQVAIFLVLGLTWKGWLLCHFAFALHWSALQYVNHAWSPRDIIHGAWNLKVSSISSALALNYHYHLAHHRYPALPWIHLPKHVKPEDDRPTFWKIYFSLYGGTRPAPPMLEQDQTLIMETTTGPVKQSTTDKD